MNAKNERKRNYTLAIPLEEKEIEELDKYTKVRGLKKGHFVRKAILEKLAREDRA
jgi:hypothetical protein